MPRSDAFKQVMERIADETPVRELAERSGFHRATVYEMVKGNIPGTPGRLAAFAHHLQLGPEVRAELFAAAGYLDPVAQGITGTPSLDLGGLEKEICCLSAEDQRTLLAVIRAFVRDRLRQ